MKKIVISMVLICLCMPAYSFGYMENKLFCRVDKQEIKVSIGAKQGVPCQSYVLYIEQSMRQLARDLYTLQDYITLGQDVAYWTQIKKDKLATIDKLQGVRLTVIASMKSFESSLLKTAVDYFLQKIAAYRVQLTTSLVKLSALTGTQATESAHLYTLMSGQLQTIEKMAKVQTFEELIPLLNGYIYFKQQISGKSE